VVSQNTAGAPKRRLTIRRHGSSHIHTLQSMTIWSISCGNLTSVNARLTVSANLTDGTKTMIANR
jgi:hypothetical protein